MRSVGWTLVALGLLAAPAGAKVLWHEDFSTGDLRRWDECQSAALPGLECGPERLRVVPAPLSGGREKALRAALLAGDVAYNPRHTPPVPMGNRSELVHLPYVHEGEERWYRLQIYFPDGFRVTDGKGGGAVFLQWHHWKPDDESGSPPLLFTAMTHEIRAISVPGLESQAAHTLGSTRQIPGKWRDLVVHVRFSSDPSEGLVQAWADGDRFVDAHVATLFPGYEAYLKMGLYRRPSAQEANVVYFKDVVEATSREDVERGSPAGRRGKR